MTAAFPCRTCGGQVLAYDADQARQLGCTGCGWRISIPCEEPLLLEEAVLPAPDPAPIRPQPRPAPRFHGVGASLFVPFASRIAAALGRSIGIA